MNSYITAAGTAVPQYQIDQKKASEWMALTLGMNDRESKVLQSLYESSGIKTRYTVVPDYLRDKGSFEFFPNSSDLEPFPTVSSRMGLYRQNALPLAVSAIKNTGDNLENVTHLIVVSCTGMYAPGLDIELIEELGLDTTVERIAIQFMGCYAAVNALKTADYICKSNNDAKVLIVCVELCTIHFQKGKSRDELVANALFGDGASAVIVQANPTSGVNLSLESFHCQLAPESRKDMAWQIADTGFIMALSSYVPAVIKKGIKNLSTTLLTKTGLLISDIEYFAIHPGGRRILEVCEEELELDKEKNCRAYEVLENFGNMSSPTVLFVIKKHFDSLQKESSGKYMMSFAFGPGLVIESMLLKTHYA